MYIGYVFDQENGTKYEKKIYFEEDMEMLAAFVMSNNYNKMVTDSSDNFLLNTIGSYVDKCQKDILEELLKVLIPIQENEKEIPEFKEVL